MLYIINVLSGMLEFGFIMRAARCGWNPAVFLLFPLAYQVGRLFPKPFSLGKRPLIVLFVLSATVGCCMIFIDFAPTVLIALTCLNIAFLSTMINSVKETFIPVEGKRSALLEWGSRLAGIIAALLCAFFPISVMFFALAVLFHALRYHLRITSGKFKPGEIPLLSVVEVVAYAIGLIVGCSMAFWV
jgi:hypothetical protein